MNFAESLVGHLLTRNGTKYLIIKADETSVLAAYRDKSGRIQRALIPLAEAVQGVADVNQVDLPDAPEPTESKYTVV